MPAADFRAVVKETEPRSAVTQDLQGLSNSADVYNVETCNSDRGNVQAMCPFPPGDVNSCP